MATNLANAGVDLIAGPTGASVQAARTNSAMELADSLSKLEPTINNTLGQYVDRKKAEAEAKAEADALKNSGAGFADAVREGKLEATQNPWYISAYEKNAAQVRAQAEVSTLLEESQSWEERNDPAAFSTKWAAKVGEIRQAYKTPELSAGFEAAANPLSQQAVQANVAENVQRIKQERNQDISTLATKGILDGLKLTPNMSPEAMFNAMEPQREEWLATGGTEQQWNLLAVNATIAAAYNSNDLATAEMLLDNLSADYGGRGSLSHISGPSGNPIAEDIAQAKFRIGQNIQYKDTQQLRAIENAAKLEGSKGVNEVYAQFGTGFTLGQVSQVEIIEHLAAKGYSPRGTAEAIKELSQAASASSSLSRSLMGADEEVLQLNVDARQKGWSPALQAKTFEMVRTGRININEAESIIANGISQTKSEEAEGRAAARQANSEAKADARELRTMTANAAAQLKSDRDQYVGWVSSTLQGKGDKSLLDPTKRASFVRGMQDAEGNYLMSHPGDLDGASEAAKQYANNYLTSRTAPKTAPPAAKGGANPRSR